MFPIKTISENVNFFGPIISIFGQKRGILLVDLDLIVPKDHDIPTDQYFWAYLYLQNGTTTDLSSIDPGQLDQWKRQLFKGDDTFASLSIIRKWLHQCTFVKVGTGSYRSLVGRKASLIGQSFIIINNDKEVDKEVDKEIDKEIDKEADKELSHREVDKKVDKEIDKEIDKKVDKEVGTELTHKTPRNPKYLKRMSSFYLSKIPIEKFQSVKLAISPSLEIKIPVIFSRNIGSYLKETVMETVNLLRDGDSVGDANRLVLPIGTVPLFRLREQINRDKLLVLVRQFMDDWSADPNTECSYRQEKYQEFWRSFMDHLSASSSITRNDTLEIVNMLERYIISKIVIPIDETDHLAQTKFMMAIARQKEDPSLKDELEKEAAATVGGNTEFAKIVSKLIRSQSVEAPVDKINCYSNACKTLSLLLKRNGITVNADTLLPLLVYSISEDPPTDFYLDLQFCLKYRVAEYFNGESSYFLTTMFAAVQFLTTTTNVTKNHMATAKTETTTTTTATATTKNKLDLRKSIMGKLLSSGADDILTESDFHFILEYFLDQNGT